MDTEPPVAEQQYSSRFTRDLVREAEHALGEVLDGDRLDEQFSKLVASVDEKDEAKLQQLQGLAKLLRGTEEQAAFACLKRRGHFELRASDDAMTLWLDVNPPVADGEPVSMQEVLAALTERGIERGIDHQAIASAVAGAAEEEPARDVVVVRGQPATPGQDERVERFGRPSLEDPLHPIDPQEEGLLDRPWLCREGDCILHHVPAVAGAPGFDATGQTLDPPEPETVQVEAGSNVRQDQGQYFAEIGGVIGFDGRKIEVRRMLVLTEDVTSKTGFVEFEGDLTIRGGVRNGGQVRATGNICVVGPVEAANIESTHGSIELRHGVAGQHRGIIRAALDITTRFAENVTLFAGRDIAIKLGALHSQVAAGRAVRVSGGRGQFIGGSVAAGEFVEAKQLGSSSGVATEVLLGLTREVMLKLGKLDEVGAKIRRRRDQARELADRMLRAVGDPARLTADELKAYTALRKCEFVTDHQLEQCTQEREKLLTQAAERHDGHVDVLSDLMPRVTIRIGQGRLENEETRRRCRLVYDAEAQQVVVQPLR